LIFAVLIKRQITHLLEVHTPTDIFIDPSEQALTHN
jgi:hypothetical protein